MTAIETADQAVQLLDRAQEFLDVRRDDEAYQLLEAVEQSGLLPAPHRPRLLWLLGEACYQGQSYDAAVQYYEEAAAAGDPAVAERARARIAELQRADAAAEVAYGEGGVDTVAEWDQVTRAADEAFQRGDYGTALDLYSRAYEHPAAAADGNRIARVALGLGKTLFFQRRYDEAREYLVYVGQLSPDAAIATEAQQVLADLDQYRQAVEGAADGVQAAELRSTFEAAIEAFRRNDFESAARLFQQVHEAPYLDGRMRSHAAHNAGVSHVRLGNFDTALQWFEEAVRLGSPDSQQQIDRLRAGDRALEQIGQDLLSG